MYLKLVECLDSNWIGSAVENECTDKEGEVNVWENEEMSNVVCVD